MPLDGFDTNLQKACDVTVGVLRGGQFGDPAFACGGSVSVGVSGVCDGDAREVPAGANRCRIALAAERRASEDG
jgi:hypothetical protein